MSGPVGAPRTGRFVTLEGGEGAGKSTQAKSLAARLAERGVDVLATREPGGAPGADEIRALLVSGAVDRWAPETELLLHYAARTEHMRRTVRPALDAGRWVLCDRFADSTMAYQGYGHELGREVVQRLHEIVLDGFAPDLTVVLDLPIEAGLKRTDERPHAENRYERMGPGFHARVREGFLDIARREPARCAVVDATMAPEAVTHAILALIEERLGPLA